MSSDSVPSPSKSKSRGSGNSGSGSAKKKPPTPGQPHKKKLDIVGGPHILQTAWTFWYCKKTNKQQLNFETALVSLGTCHSIEEFWGHYSHIKRPHELPPNSNLHLFRGNTRPMWENFPTGGHWVLHMRKNSPLLDRMWEELLISCIGEAFEEPDVLGVVLSLRPKEDALYLWNANQQLKFNIGEKLKTIMQLPANCPIEYRTNRFNMERSQVSQKIESEDPTNPAQSDIPGNPGDNNPTSNDD